MRRAKLAARSRSHLDRTLEGVGAGRAIRAARAARMDQSRPRSKQPSVIALERSEEKGTIELATLRRVAAALDCTLVYALVPNKPLEAIVRDRARKFLRRRLEPVEHTMLLEGQKVSAKAKDSKARLDELVRETSPRLFWD